LNFVVSSGTIQLAQGTGKSFLTTTAIAGTDQTVSNSQCTVLATLSSVTIFGNTVTANIFVTFTVLFSGAKQIFMPAENRDHPDDVRLQTQVGTYNNNMGGALFAGGFLNAMMRNSDAVSIANMTGILEFGGIWKKREQVYGSPAYWTLRTYANARPRILLKVDSNSSTFNISKGVIQLPEILGAPYLDIVAAESEDRGKLLLFCVNRHLTRPQRAVIDLSSLGIVGGSAKVTTIAADDVLAENDEYNPERVVAVSHEMKFSSKGSYTFPNASVTVVEIPLAK
jgi:alpha-L-arabinofuranosidase